VVIIIIIIIINFSHVSATDCDNATTTILPLHQLFYIEECTTPWYAKAKAGMVHSGSGCTWGMQVKLWDPLKMLAIP